MKKIEVYLSDVLKTMFIVISITCACLIGIRLAKEVEFNNNCGYYFERAEKAPNAETACEAMKIGISYMESKGLTYGQTYGFIEEKNTIGIFYETMVKFKDEFASFDVSTESEVYNVELNSLQERMAMNTIPYFISMGSKYLVWVYMAGLVMWCIVLLMFLYCLEYRENKKIYVYIPVLVKKPISDK